MLELIGGFFLVAIIGCLVGSYFIAEATMEFVSTVFPYVLCFLFFGLAIIFIIIGFKNIMENGKKTKAIFALISGILLFVFLPRDYSLTRIRDDHLDRVCAIGVKNTSSNEKIECVKLRYKDSGRWHTVYPCPLTLTSSDRVYGIKGTVNELLVRYKTKRKFIKYNGDKGEGVGISLYPASVYGSKTFDQFSLMIITSNDDTRQNKKCTFNEVYFDKKYVYRHDAEQIQFVYDGDKISINYLSDTQSKGVLKETVSQEQLFSDDRPLKKSYEAKYYSEIYKFWRKKGIRFFRTDLRNGGISIF